MVAAGKSTAKHGNWTEGDLRVLVEGAGRMPFDRLCRALRREPEEVRQVAARVRQAGYPIGLEVETCPMCGARAPIVYSLGICRPCSYRRGIREKQRQMAEVLPRLAEEDRATYGRTESNLGARALEPMPEPPAAPGPGASAAELMAYEESRCAQESDWEARRLFRELRAASKRKERMDRKAMEHAAQAVGQA